MPKEHAQESLANPDAKGGDGKPKVMCTGCLPAQISQEAMRDHEEIRTGACQEIRNETSVIDWLWSASHSDPNKQWLTGRTETMLRHLWKCQNVPAAVWDAAQVACVQWCLLTNSPTIPRVVGQNEYPSSNLLPAPTFTLPLQSQVAEPSSSDTSGVVGPYPAMNDSTPTVLMPMPQLSVSAPAQESLPPSRLIIPAACYPSDYRHSPVLSSIALSPSPSQPCMSVSRQLSTSNLSVLLSAFGTNRPWTDADKAHFGACIAWITASCGFPFSWVENLEWLGFLQEFIPQAEPIKHQSLANRWIPAE
ncbi:hypothetical protein EDC04DRAFT_3126530, partial [Pisolithus marmoratus]